VVAALHSLKDDKASGPDGFPSKFYIEFWEVIRPNVMEVLVEFHAKAS